MLFRSAGGLYWSHKRKAGVSSASFTREPVCSALLVCYITGLISLTIFIHIISDIWYVLLYHRASGYHHRWFVLEYYMVPDFFRNFGSESLGNILMYLSFGILYPLSQRDMIWHRTLCVGFSLSLVIEFIQPVFGRSFDINDIILNTLGVLSSATVFFLLRALVCKR